MNDYPPSRGIKLSTCAIQAEYLPSPTQFARLKGCSSRLSSYPNHMPWWTVTRQVLDNLPQIAMITLTGGSYGSPGIIPHGLTQQREASVFLEKD